MPEIINFRNIPKGTWPAHAVRIDRATPWGNKFSHLDYGKGEIKVQSREASVACFELQMKDPGEWAWDFATTLEQFQELRLQREWILQHIHELAGMDLVCWCAPQACHGDVLMRLANES